MRCLNCGREMVNNLAITRDARISYDMCEACGSLWLDAGELDKMAYQVKGSIEFCSDEQAPADRERSAECPRCEGVQLRSVYFIGCRDIVLDHCPNCRGFWLDGGKLDLVNRELERIMPVNGKGFSEFVNEVHLPYWHKRVRRRGPETDSRPPAPPIRVAALKEPDGAPCPVCSGRLSRCKVHGVAFDGCPQCGGMWLEREKLRALKDRAVSDAWHSLRWLDQEVDALEKTTAVRSARPCPRCAGQRLLSTRFGGSRTMVDWCPSCHGIWLDQDDFQQIVDYLKDRLDSMSSQEIRERLYREVREIGSGPEGVVGEVRDAAAALGALINAEVFEHPVLGRVLRALAALGRSVGL